MRNNRMLADHPEEERHTKLPEETIKIKIKNSLEEKDILRGVINHTVEAVVKLSRMSYILH